MSKHSLVPVNVGGSERTGVGKTIYGTGLVEGNPRIYENSPQSAPPDWRDSEEERER